MADRLISGLKASAAKYNLPFVIFNQGSICHVDTVGTMHYAIDWSKPWQLPKILKETGRRQKEMEHMGAAYMAEGIVTLAGSRRNVTVFAGESSPGGAARRIPM